MKIFLRKEIYFDTIIYERSVYYRSVNFVYNRQILYRYSKVFVMMVKFTGKYIQFIYPGGFELHA